MKDCAILRVNSNNNIKNVMNCDGPLTLVHRKLFLPSDSYIHDLTHMYYEHGLLGADLPAGKLLIPHFHQPTFMSLYKAKTHTGKTRILKSRFLSKYLVFLRAELGKSCGTCCNYRIISFARTEKIY